MVMVKIESDGQTRVAFLEARVDLTPSDVVRLRRATRDFDRQTAKFDVCESCINRSWLNGLITKPHDKLSIMFFFCGEFTVTRTPWIAVPILDGLFDEGACVAHYSRRKRHRRETRGSGEGTSMLCTTTRVVEVKMKIVRTPVVVNVEVRATPLSDGSCFVRLNNMNLRLPISSGETLAGNSGALFRLGYRYADKSSRLAVLA